MAKNEVVKFEESIRDRIYSIRGFQVMLDSDLAELYGVETKRINEAVKRNKERFPVEFCFMLKYSEVPELRSQIATANKAKISKRSQIVSGLKKGRTNLPAEKSIVIVDNYVDDTVLLHLSKILKFRRFYVSLQKILFNSIDLFFVYS
jgi:hypothetical protein